MRRETLLPATSARTHAAARPPRRPGVLVRLVLAVCLVALTGRAVAQDMPVPVDLQVSLFTRLLEYERRIAESDGEIVIGVAYQPALRESVVVHDAALAALAGTATLHGRPVRLVSVDLEGAAGLRLQLERDAIDVLYIAPVRVRSLDELVGLTRELGTLTCTGVPRYVEEGIAIGVDNRGGRPLLMVNLEAARAEGARLRPEILRLARIVEGS